MEVFYKSIFCRTTVTSGHIHSCNIQSPDLNWILSLWYVVMGSYFSCGGDLSNGAPCTYRPSVMSTKRSCGCLRLKRKIRSEVKKKKRKFLVRKFFYTLSKNIKWTTDRIASFINRIEKSVV